MLTCRSVLQCPLQHVLCLDIPLRTAARFRALGTVNKVQAKHSPRSSPQAWWHHSWPHLLQLLWGQRPVGPHVVVLHPFLIIVREVLHMAVASSVSAPCRWQGCCYPWSLVRARSAGVAGCIGSCKLRNDAVKGHARQAIPSVVRPQRQNMWPPHPGAHIVEPHDAQGPIEEVWRHNDCLPAICTYATAAAPGILKKKGPHALSLPVSLQAEQC
jgi:hypothetical protein